MRNGLKSNCISWFIYPERIFNFRVSIYFPSGVSSLASCCSSCSRLVIASLQQTQLPPSQRCHVGLPHLLGLRWLSCLCRTVHPSISVYIHFAASCSLIVHSSIALHDALQIFKFGGAWQLNRLQLYDSFCHPVEQRWSVFSPDMSTPLVARANNYGSHKYCFSTVVYYVYALLPRRLLSRFAHHAW